MLAEGDVDLLDSDEYWDPHAVAGLLKSFLRELPASILTRDLHLRFLAVIGAKSEIYLVDYLSFKPMQTLSTLKRGFKNSPSSLARCPSPITASFVL